MSDNFEYLKNQSSQYDSGMKDGGVKDDEGSSIFSLTKLSLDKSKAVFVFFFICVIFGVSSYNSLAKEWSPDIQIPYLFVSTPYPQSSPEDVETLVTRILEKNMKNISGLKSIKSTSSDGISLITLEFNQGVLLSEARDKVNEGIDKSLADLPEDAQEPTITELNLSEQPIMMVVFSGDMDEEEQTNIVDDAKEIIEGVEGVLEVKRIGGVTKEIQVLVDPQTLEYYKLGLNDVSKTILNENTNMPIGTLDIQPMGFVLRSIGEIENPSDLENLIIASPNDIPIYIRDVARVVFTQKDKTTASRLNGSSAVNLSVSKRAGENLQEIASKIKEIIAEFEKKYEGSLKISILGDQSQTVNNNLSSMENNIYSGFILVILVLLFFMGVRNSFLVGIAIPLSMLISFIFLTLAGITLNMVVVFSLILALGMLVDNAVVVVENIYRHAEMGQDRYHATLDGVSEVAYPVISSTLTTLSAFFPLIFMPGIIGEFIKFLPITVIIVLFSSLLVALIFNPVFCRYFIKIPKKAGLIKDEEEAANSSMILRAYAYLLDYSLKMSWLVIIITLLIFIGTIYYYVAHVKAGVEFFPKDEPSEASITISAPFGSTLEESDRIVTQIEKILVPHYPNLKSVVSNLGSARGGGSSSGEHNNYITLTFPQWQDWVEKPSDVIEMIREDLKKEENQTSGADVILELTTSGPPTQKPVNIEISGADLIKLKEIATEIKGQILDIEGLVNLNDDLDLNRSEIVFKPDRNRLNQLGLSLATINDIARTAISGKEISTYRIGKEDYDIVVKLSDEQIKNFEDILQIPITIPSGEVMYLSELVHWETKFSLGSIRHIDRERTITISADAQGLPGAELLKLVQERLNDYSPPTGYKLSYTGESADQKETQTFIVGAFGLAFLLIFLILVWQFNSFIITFTILSTVFVSFIGVFLGLIINNAPFSIVMGGIGLVSLAGVVVNNGIIMLNYVKQLQKKGKGLRKAIILGCSLRLRPIFLTATTTIFAMMPLILGVDINFYRWPDVLIFGAGSGEIWKPMANTLVYGLGVATVITLFFGPSLFYALCWLKYGFAYSFAWLKSTIKGTDFDPGPSPYYQ